MRIHYENLTPVGHRLARLFAALHPAVLRLVNGVSREDYSKVVQDHYWLSRHREVNVNLYMSKHPVMYWQSARNLKPVMKFDEMPDFFDRATKRIELRVTAAAAVVDLSREDWGHMREYVTETLARQIAHHLIAKAEFIQE